LTDLALVRLYGAWTRPVATLGNSDALQDQGMGRLPVGNPFGLDKHRDDGES